MRAWPRRLKRVVPVKRNEPEHDEQVAGFPVGVQTGEGK